MDRRQRGDFPLGFFQDITTGQGVFTIQTNFIERARSIDVRKAKTCTKETFPPTF
jgi:hypothetical protein